jgi:cell division protein FtsW
MSPEKNHTDYPLIVIVIALLGVGTVMVLSSSAVWAYYKHNDSLYFLKRQMLWVVLGFVTMFFLSSYNYWKLKKLSKVILFITIVMLIAVLIPGIGVEINYARRWIGFGSLTFQPSEFAKLSMIIYLASSLSRKREYLENFFVGVAPILIVLGVICSLILIQPDLSTAVIIAVTVMVMLFAGGTKASHLVGLMFLSVPAGIFLVLSEEYRRERFFSFLNPWADKQDAGYHIIQSLYALGSGGLLGVGLGQSRQKFFYLPEPQTDFIFAILGEELGFIGGLLVILLFALFVWRGCKIALAAPDYFGCVLAFGITALIGIQALINLAVVTASMPVTGMPLPFISFGGSSMVITMGGVGILLNIAKHTNN